MQVKEGIERKWKRAKHEVDAKWMNEDGRGEGMSE